MNAPFARTFRLVPRGGAGLACDDDGVALGPVSLVEAWRDEGGKLRFRAKPLAEVGKAMRLAYGDAKDETVARHHRGLSRIAELLAAGEGTRARIHAVQLGFGDIDDDGMARVPNDEPGAEEWTGGGGPGKSKAAHGASSRRSASRPRKNRNSSTIILPPRRKRRNN